MDNFLTSGYEFSENENLLKFRFSLLNILILVATSFAFLNFLISFFGIIDFGKVFETAVFVFSVLNFFVIYLLRIKKLYYFFIVIFFIVTSLILFYFVLFVRKEDEFRLIAFFLAVFITYVLLGKKYGLGLAVFVGLSIFFISKHHNLELSPFAYSTFFSFFIIFTIFLYFFLNKIERDAEELKVLNNKLKDNFKREVQQRKDQESMLLRQCRMASMGQMLDSIAHQWRQPLMHINSVLLNMDSFIESRGGDDKYLTNKSNEIAMLTMHMSNTIEDFRGLFEIEKGQEEFFLESVIADVLVLMKNRFSGILVDCEVGEDVLIYGSKSELIQVIIILFSNTVDAFERKIVNNKKVSIGTNNSKDSTIVTIKDNAGGIAPENLGVVFDPYFTTKELSGGTGLGLYLAKIIIEQKMNGRITVSNTSTGALFSISLPRMRV